MEEKQYRYPGTLPFSEKDRELFFGRTKDIRQLTELIVLEKLVVLFSKSGYGKTSLLNAGVIPRLTEEENHIVLKIRLNEPERSPVELLIYHLKNIESEDIWLHKKLNLAAELAGDPAALLWYYTKNIQLSHTDNQAVTLVFDQFEELFNYTATQIQEFSRTIATLLNLNMPDTVRMLIKQKITTDPGYFTETETDQLLASLNLKVVFSLRSDRLSLLNQLKTYLPAVFKKTYELQPLDEVQALEAILEPAMKKGRPYASPPFSYTKASTDLILTSLKDHQNQRIETFQLQLICHHAEELIIRKHQNLPDLSEYEITGSDLGKPEDIFKSHYLKIIDELPEKDKHAVRILIEENLIIGNDRVPLPESTITDKHHIPAHLLKTLEDKRLLRREPNTVGGTSYELSHDTLVEPITKAADVRRKQEKEAQAEAERQEEIRKLKEKQLRDRRRLILAMAALFLAFTLSGIAIWKWIDAEKQKTIATSKTREAEDNLQLANRKTREAEDNLQLANRKTQEAEDNLQLANRKTREAESNLLLANNKAEELAIKQIELEQALKEVKAAKDTTEQKRIETELAKNLAVQEQLKTQTLADGVLELLKEKLPTGVTNVYTYYLLQADTAFSTGSYDKAIGLYRGAKLLAKTADRQNAIETKMHKARQCIDLFTEAGQFVFDLKLPEAIAVYHHILKLNPTDPKAAWRIKAFSRPSTLSMLQSLKLVTVHGGSFMMGSNDGAYDEKPVHKVILTDYQIGRYEITNAQYAGFLNQYGSIIIKYGEYKGKEMIDLSGSYENEKCRIYVKGNKYEVENNYETNPVIYVNWYGAYEFCCFYGLNLPTEARWEFAARGGNQSKGFVYAGSNDIDEVSVNPYNNNTGTKATGGKKANELGLYDMSGNVREWCNDWYGSYSSGDQVNPAGPENGRNRVVRGGSWYFYDYSCRVAYRYSWSPAYGGNIDLGFRACFVP